MTDSTIPPSPSEHNSNQHTLPFERISTIPVDLTIELGKAKLTVEELMALKEGDIVALNKLKHEPFDIKVNGKNVAEGQVVVADDQFYMKVTKILDKVEHG